MISETGVFIACTTGLIITETILIISVLKLNSSIKKVSSKLDFKFENLSDKIKGLVELFIAVQTNKLKHELPKEEGKKDGN